MAGMGAPPSPGPSPGYSPSCYSHSYMALSCTATATPGTATATDLGSSMAVAGVPQGAWALAASLCTALLRTATERLEPKMEPPTLPACGGQPEGNTASGGDGQAAGGKETHGSSAQRAAPREAVPDTDAGMLHAAGGVVGGVHLAAVLLRSAPVALRLPEQPPAEEASAAATAPGAGGLSRSRPSTAPMAPTAAPPASPYARGRGGHGSGLASVAAGTGHTADDDGLAQAHDYDSSAVDVLLEGVKEPLLLALTELPAKLAPPTMLPLLPPSAPGGEGVQALKPVSMHAAAVLQGLADAWSDIMAAYGSMHGLDIAQPARRDAPLHAPQARPGLHMPLGISRSTWQIAQAAADPLAGAIRHHMRGAGSGSGPAERRVLRACDGWMRHVALADDPLLSRPAGTVLDKLLAAALQ